MEKRIDTGSLRRLVVFLLLSILAVGGAAVYCLRSSDIAFVRGDSRAQWIMFPSEVEIIAQTADFRHPRPVTFARSFDAGHTTNATLRLRAFRSARVYLNGKRVGGPTDPKRWKLTTTLHVSRGLRRGRNTLRVEVSNASGPALLYLYADGLPSPLRTDESWTVTDQSGTKERAIIADDTRPHAEWISMPSTVACVAENWPLLAGVFVVSGAVFLLRKRLPAKLTRRPAYTALVAATAAWLIIFVVRVLQIPLEMGFDSDAHLLYVDYILSHHRLPLPDSGWSTYHPPLYYVLAAIGVSLGGLPGIKGVAFLSGLGSVCVAHALAQRLFGSQSRRTVIATLFAASLPMNIVLSAYVSNESTHAFLAGLAILTAVYALYQPKGRQLTYGALGLALGLSLLAKQTAVIIAPVVLAVVAWKLVVVEKPSRTRTAKLLATTLVPMSAVGGWFYMRDWILYGNPLFGNWSLVRKGIGWWQQPGFHTPAYYLSFGDSLIHPYLCGFRSYWDSMYSTLWGDGQLAGRIGISYRHMLWNYDLMSIVYLLAIPATLLLGLGFVKAIRESMT
ncbi:MAG: glycosyltransferase family 39 protein, partial [Armatimonadota bacterium]